MRIITVLCIALATALQAQVPLEWVAESSKAKAAEFTAYRGETLFIHPTMEEYGSPMTNYTATLFYQTNGMGSAWWEGTNGMYFTPAMDVGASAYSVYVQAVKSNGISYRANAIIRMLNSPGATPNLIPMPVQRLDFASIEYLNAPWLLAADLDPVESRIGSVEGGTNAWNAAASWGNHASAGYLASSLWLSWLSTNTYIRVESDPTVAGAIQTHGTNTTAHASLFGSKWSNPAYSTNLTWTSDGKEITIVGHHGYSTDIVIPEVLDGLPVTKIGNAAFQLANITSIYAPSVISVGMQAFSENPMISNFLPNMTVIGDGAFSYTDITSVDMPLLKTVGVEAFSGCSSLSSVSLPSATAIGYSAFFDCDALITVHLPVAVYLGETAFFGCANLTTVKLPQLEVFNDGALALCPKLNAVYFDADVPPTIGADLYTGSTVVTNYIKRTTAVWPETFGGRPVVRMPLEGTVIKIGAVNASGNVEAQSFTRNGIPFTGGGSSDPLSWTPISTVPVSTIATARVTTAKSIFYFESSEAVSFTNDLSAWSLNCTSNVSWTIRFACNGTNACGSTNWLGNCKFVGFTPEMTCTGVYEYACETSCGNQILVRQTFPTIYQRERVFIGSAVDTDSSAMTVSLVPQHNLKTTGTTSNTVSMLAQNVSNPSLVTVWIRAVSLNPTGMIIYFGHAFKANGGVPTLADSDYTYGASITFDSNSSIYSKSFVVPACTSDQTFIVWKQDQFAIAGSLRFVKIEKRTLNENEMMLYRNGKKDF